MACLRTFYVVETTNVSREEKQELKDFLSDNCWSFKEETKEY